MRLTLALLCVSAHFIADAQSSPTLEMSSDPEPVLIEFNGTKYNGYVIEFNSPPDLVEEVVKEKFKSQGVKPKKTDGFLVFRGVLLHQIDPGKPMDAFIRIERKSKTEKDKSVAYLIAAYQGEIPEEKTKSGKAVMTVGTTSAVTGGMVLKGLHPDIEQKAWERSVLDQEAALKKEEKKLNDLKKAQVEMENKIEQLKVNLETNAQDQIKQTEVVDKAKNDLNDLLSKKPGNN